jgi:hypothetical protein
MNYLWNWIGHNQDHFWSALSAIGAIGTLFIAYRALRIWHDEKQYDLSIENLALCNSAVRYIHNLRSTVSYSDEITNKEYIKELARIEAESESVAVKRAAKSMFVYQSRKDKQANLYEQILKLRERNWATYGPEHDFYKFYNFIIELDYKIWTALFAHYSIHQDSEGYSDEERNKIIKDTKSIFYGLGPDDDTSKELDNWITKLQTHRRTR